MSKIRVRTEYIAAKDPFSVCGIRELSRRTGLDYSYLVKVRNGRYSITEDRYNKLLKAAGDYTKKVVSDAGRFLQKEGIPYTVNGERLSK